MRSNLIVALRAALVTLVVTGVVYPLVVTAASQLLFRDEANGSLLRRPDGKILGSSLVAQDFARAGYLKPRPSAAGANGFDGTSSGGSNLGPTSQKLRDRVVASVEQLRKENPDAPGDVPAELVTTSGSGLDPHLSPEAALWQAPRIAQARGVAVERVRAVIRQHTDGPTLGLLGEPRVNVLELNLDLDRQLGPLPGEVRGG